MREDLGRVTGRLLEVSNLDADTAWIGVDSIEGLEDRELLTATIKSPAPETDAVLERIGRHGQITLEGPREEHARRGPRRCTCTRSGGSTSTWSRRLTPRRRFQVSC